MNVIFLYQIWQQDTRVGSSRDTYTLYMTTTNIEEAQAICQDSDGKYVYTFLQSFYGENG